MQTYTFTTEDSKLLQLVTGNINKYSLAFEMYAGSPQYADDTTFSYESLTEKEQGLVDEAFNRVGTLFMNFRDGNNE